MTLQAYQTLYESSIAYGMRKALQAEQRNAEMQIKIGQLEDTCDELDVEVDELKQKIMYMLADANRERDMGKQIHDESVTTYSTSINTEMTTVKKGLTPADI